MKPVSVARRALLCLLCLLFLLSALVGCESTPAISGEDLPYQTVTWGKNDGALNKKAPTLLADLKDWMTKEGFADPNYIAAVKKYRYGDMTCNYGGTILQGEYYYSHGTTVGPATTKVFRDLVEEGRYLYESSLFAVKGELTGLTLPGRVKIGASVFEMMKQLALPFDPATEFRSDRDAKEIMTLLSDESSRLVWDRDETTLTYTYVEISEKEDQKTVATELRLVFLCEEGILTQVKASLLRYHERDAEGTAQPESTSQTE